MNVIIFPIPIINLLISTNYKNLKIKTNKLNFPNPYFKFL